MAFETFVIAMSWRAGAYALVEKYSLNNKSEVDWARLEAEQSWNDISENSSYQDYVMAVGQRMFEKYALGAELKEFIARTSTAPTFFYLLHRAEFESGLSVD